MNTISIAPGLTLRLWRFLNSRNPLVNFVRRNALIVPLMGMSQILVTEIAIHFP